jgi:undecaprenyl phosphate N,N'-diacetylbacillosamine 1-phosphate transferase
MYKRFIKRVFDFLFALILVLPITLVIVICALLIKLEDGGPVFFSGKRLGKNGKSFKMYKLRSMKVNAPDIRNNDGSTFNSNNDPRLTSIGKFIRKTSLDELPQILNVLVGDMSFIGPRPDLPEHIDYYEVEELRKLQVLPGVSGFNQAYFRNSAEWKQRLQNDVYYVDNISILLDIKILLKTLEVVAFRKGIYIPSKSRSMIGEGTNERSIKA